MAGAGSDVPFLSPFRLRESRERRGAGRRGRREEIKGSRHSVPLLCFVRQVAGDQVELSLVIPAGMDSHSFEPTPRDIRTMQEADVIIANGGAMEHWVDQVVDSFDREDQTVVIMMDHVDAVEEEIVEGMEHSDEGHGHVHVHEDGEEDGHLEEDESQYEIEYDEHILSLIHI